MHISSPSEQIRTIKFTFASAITVALSFVLINSRVWLALSKNDAAADNVFAYDAIVEGAPKATGAAWVVGDALYWDDTAKKFTTTSSGNTACGYAGSAQASGDTTGTLILKTFP